MCFVCKLTYFQRSQVNSKQKKVKIEKSWCVRNISTRLLKTKMAVSWDLSKTFCELTRHFNLELKLRRVNLFFKKKLLTKNYNLDYLRWTIPRVNRAHTKQVPLEWRCYVKIIEVRGGIWEKKSDEFSCRVQSRGIFTYVGVCIALTAPVTSWEFETITCWTAKLPWTTNDHIDNSLFAVQWCASRDQREVITRVMRDIGIHGKFLWKWLVHIVWLAQLAECRTTMRESGGSNLARTNTRSSNNWV